MINTLTRRPLIASLTVLCLLMSMQAKTQKTMPGDIVIIASKILHENRTIYIHCPKTDSDNINKRFPVLYLLDGESHFDMLSQYADYLGRWDVKAIPQMIVVGIVNTKRTRDLTPTVSIINYFGKPDTAATSWMKPSGGNEEFLQFIHEELMPYVDANYKTQSYKVLAGHSFGGIASINCLLTHPAMFDAYIAISPSFWWDREYILKLADKTLQKGNELNKALFYSDAGEGISDSSTFHTNLLRFDSIVSAKKINGLVYNYKYYPAETHMTEPVIAYYDALRFVFKKWTEK